MPKKRRNNGRNKKNRGHVKAVRCDNCSRYVPKDKCIKKFVVRDLIDASSKDDIAAVSAYKKDGQQVYIPKLYHKLTYCVSCAIHARIVRVRSRVKRRVRKIPRKRGPRRDNKKNANEKNDIKTAAN